MAEEWRPVPGYEGHYEVSSVGRVRSVERYIAESRTGTRLVRERIRKLGIGTHGYPVVRLHIGGRGETFTIHVLVARAFLGPPPVGHEVCHNDGTKTNNSVGNLRYGTHAENMRDLTGHGVGRGVQTHCKHGHEFTPENTYARRSGGRDCRTCNLASSRLRWLARKEAS